MGPVRPGEECCSPVDFVAVPEPIEHSVDGVPNEVGSSSVDSVPVPIEHSGLRGTADMPSTGPPMKHSETSGDGCCDGNSPLDVRTGDQRISLEDEDAIVVGVVGSAAP